MTDETKKTIQDFGEQWTHFRDNPGYYGSTALLQDICGPLLDVKSLAGKRTADIGSGTGRIVNMLLDAGVSSVCAVEPSDAFLVLQENTRTRRERVTYVHDVGEKLPEDGQYDLVVSLGVLHHIPDPDPVVRAAFRALRPEGQLLIWLYGREGNELYLAIFGPLRWVTKRLPHRLLLGVCSALNVALDVYIALCRRVRLPMRDYMLDHLALLDRSVRRLTIYDQINPAYAKYYSREEAEDLLRRAGFSSVTAHHRHGYSWTVTGSKS
jgi:SAM-dependent methyltransferase